ncbi:GTPase HflX [Anaerobacillus alkalidiazotrophicus]|uniref:GTPase HflX n=1 Tax=Anaerobacillus alkalidiazotrophicus TaxID=472963 RepID=A0A1S2M092_9BACI|nr:GTPase HflX [Anaerobacillus alkalidiazotrophicus]OIJ17920.1 GTPase HflX [Anaerobacillus alkalidiazotrophicus]
MGELSNNTEEKVLLVGCKLFETSEERFRYSMEELASLTKTAGGKVISTVFQNRHSFDRATYIGKGKIEEIIPLVEELEIDVVIFNDELSSSQVRNLNSQISARIIDRTQLILDIFSRRAKSKEGKLQVELAQLNYLLPRLVGQGHSLSRLGGGIGTRGPGETQLETDRRHIRRRMDEIKEQLKTIVKHRTLYRERRKENRTLQVALVGYTNAGKSTLHNRLTKADALEEDLLFATLDPLTRRLKLPSGFQVLLTDTVGFIQDLPTTLVAAFRSTLEEVCEADFLLHVVDCSSDDYYNHEQTVLSLLDELNVKDVPILTVYNKRDNMTSNFIPSEGIKSIIISALQEKDLEKLLKKLEEEIIVTLQYFEAKIHVSEGKLIAKCSSSAIIEKQTWLEDEESYFLSGYVSPDTSIYKQLQEFKV